MDATFEYIKKIWIQLWGLSQLSMNTISSRLETRNINLTMPKTALPENFSPQKLLLLFESVLMEPPERAPAPGPGLLPKKAATATSALKRTATPGPRGGASSRVNFREYIKAGIHKIRKKDGPSPPDSPDVGFLESWNSEVVPSLRQKVSEFRTDKFKSLKIEQFLSLRREQMLEG